jgi:hypothetical protein
MARVDVLKPESAAGAGPTERLGYRPALDGLRAIAIGLVLLHHTSAFLVTSWSATVFPGGFLGVDLFLVLSGFLITTLLLERHRREPRPIATFYLRRAPRLLPAVIVLLLVVAVVTVLTAGDTGRLPATFLVVLILTYTTNWAELAGVHISPYVTHLWPLAIEEQFYLVWPLLLFGALRVVRRRTTLVWSCSRPPWPSPRGGPCSGSRERAGFASTSVRTPAPTRCCWARRSRWRHGRRSERGSARRRGRPPAPSRLPASSRSPSSSSPRRPGSTSGGVPMGLSRGDQAAMASSGLGAGLAGLGGSP